MEIWSSLAMNDGMEYDLKKADGLWKEVLLHQFHDILPGSSIARVYQEAEAAFNGILAGANEMKEDALGALIDQTQKQAVTVANSLSFERKALVEVPDTFKNGAKTLDGALVPVGEADGKVKALVTVPSVGAVTIVPADANMGAEADGAAVIGAAAAGGVSVTECEGSYVLENGEVKAVVNGMGEVTSFVLKKSGREFANAPMNHFRFYKDVPRLFDAWDIDSNYIEQEIEAAYDVHVEPVSDGIEGALKVTGRIGESTYTQYITLAADSRRIEFKTEVDWRELHRLLKTSFPVNVYAENAINEMQFGYVERPTHRSKAYDKDRFEVCNHHYTALCDASHGAAVLNDCKYGISVNGNAMELTLLRAAASPEMRADNRVHTFTYGFTAWDGAFADCDVVRQGYEMNVAPTVTCGVTEAFSAVSIDKANVIMDTMKPAEDGSDDIVLRFYESKKAATCAKISLMLGDHKAYLCDMLENVKEEIPVENGSICLDFKAFEIKTVRLTRG